MAKSGQKNLHELLMELAGPTGIALQDSIRTVEVSGETLEVFQTTYKTAAMRLLGSSRKEEELRWLRRAAKVITPKFSEQALHDDINSSEEMENHEKTLEEAIVLLCIADIMLDDLVESCEHDDALNEIFLILEEYFDQVCRPEGSTEISGILEISPIGEEYKIYLKSIANIVKAMMEELKKLPNHKDENILEQMAIGFSELIASCKFSNHWNKRIRRGMAGRIRTQVPSLKEYVRQTEGNMAMKIMIGMAAMLLKDEMVPMFLRIAEGMSGPGRISNDLATFAKEAEKGQINSLVFLSLTADGSEWTADNFRELANLQDPEEKTVQLMRWVGVITAEGIPDKVVQFWYESRGVLSRIYGETDLPQIIAIQDYMKSLRELLLLELLRVPGKVKEKLLETK